MGLAWPCPVQLLDFRVIGEIAAAFGIGGSSTGADQLNGGCGRVLGLAHLEFREPPLAGSGDDPPNDPPGYRLMPGNGTESDERTTNQGLSKFSLL